MNNNKNKTEYNRQAIIDTYKNAHIALESIENILPSVEDEKLKEELKNEYDGYEKVVGSIASCMRDKNIKQEKISTMQKAMMWTSIKMKTMMNNSTNKIAEMMIKGTVMGINELTAMKNESENLDECIKEKILELLELEESYEEKLKKFL